MNVEREQFVTIDYSFKTPDGQLLGTSAHQGPLTFQAGMGDVIAGLDNHLLGRAEGESFQFVVDPAEGYGARDEALVAVLPKSELPQNGANARVGLRVDAQIGGRWRTAYISEVRDSEVVVDANHPLAGVPLHFECTVLSVSDEAPMHAGCGCGSGGCGSGGCGSGGEGESCGCGSHGDEAEACGCGSGGCGCGH